MLSKKEINNFHNNGFLMFNNFFDAKIINNIRLEAQTIYLKQLNRLNIVQETNITNISTTAFENGMRTLFKNYFNVFLNCGKQAQHLISLHRLSLDDKITNLLKDLGIKTPHISTRPVLFSNHPDIAKSSINHTVPPHQDWASMQGSINSIVIWIPLLDINQDLGSIKVIPESHKHGLITTKRLNSFGLVEELPNNTPLQDKFISYDVKMGDIIVFNAFLVHQSGNNISNHFRWSTHFRYNDLEDISFIERGYTHAYIYKPIDDIIDKEFDTHKALIKYYQ